MRRDIRDELLVIGAATVLFVSGLIFRERLNHTPHMAGEYAVFLAAYLMSGWRVLLNAIRGIVSGSVLNEHFLMMISTLGAILIHELPEAVGVMLFYKIGMVFESLSVHRSRTAITSLMEIRPDYANVLRGEDVEKRVPEAVTPGDVIVVKPGEKIPLDGEIQSGTSQVDTSTLTGETAPRNLGPGDTVLSGMISKTGTLIIVVNKPYGESSAAKILSLVEEASGKKAKTEKFITKFAGYYTPAVVLGALLVAIVPPLALDGAVFSEWVYRALVLLVISCPCALVISIPLGYFVGIGSASRRGILVKGANFLDALTRVKTVVFDKTGTLTKGVFKVSQIVPSGDMTESELIQLAAEVESQSNHPIAHSIQDAYGREVPAGAVENVEERAGMGIKAHVRDRVVIAGNDRLLHLEHIDHDVCRVEGTVIHVAVDGRYAGYIVITDELKDDAPGIRSRLRELGVKRFVMLTGDEESVAASVSKALGFDAYHAELLPEQKVALVERMSDEEPLSFVGDGINDAPVIAAADVGVAMGALGSDAAIEVADVVLMTDMPSKIADAIQVGKRTRSVIWQNIILALGIKGIFISTGILGMATMWQAVFADVGVALLAVFNATRILDA